MDISTAKFFVYHDNLHIAYQDQTIYISKDLQSILDKSKYDIGVYGVIDTTAGEKMVKIEFDYQREPYLDSGMMGMFLHFDTFMESYQQVKKVYL